MARAPRRMAASPSVLPMVRDGAHRSQVYAGCACYGAPPHHEAELEESHILKRETTSSGAQSSRPCRRARAAAFLHLSGAPGGSSVVLVDALTPLVPLLRLDRQRRDRARLEPLERDRLAGLLAIAVGTVLETGERFVDLGDQLALAIAGAQLDRPVGLGWGPVGEVGMILILILKMLQRLLRFLQDILFPVEQLLAEVLPLPLVHEGLLVGRPVVLVRRTGMPVLDGGALLLVV